jgi:hypothetical protein
MKEEALEESHILPKFIFRYQKASSPTGFIRSTKNPNQPVQDGIKLPFLCSEFEDRFAKWETKFSRNIFYPYQTENGQTFPYDEWLSKYLASVAFRVLVYVYEDCGLDYFSRIMLQHAVNSIESLRNYLLGNNSHPGGNRQLLLLLDTLDAVSIRSNPENFNIYMTRAIEFDVITTDVDSFIFVKYLKFLQLCPIYLSYNKGWRTARISHNSGILRHQDHELPDYVMNKMRAGCNALNSSIHLVSVRQESIINSRVTQNLDKLIESPVGKASLAEHLAKS